MADLSPLASEIRWSLRKAPIGRTRLYEQVAAHIEALIVSGTLRPGDRLPSERDLMQLFSVGRTAIREALFELQRKGVLSTQNGARPVVALPTPEVIFDTLSGSVGLYLSTEEGMRDFQYARRILEGSVARQAAQKTNPADVGQLEKALAENIAAAAGDPAAFMRSDVNFHLAIAQMSGSRMVVTLYRALDAWLSQQRSRSIDPRGSVEAAVRCHRQIFDAIRKGDADAAEREMHRHLAQVEDFYWSGKPGKEKAKSAPRRKTGKK